MPAALLALLAAFAAVFGAPPASQDATATARSVAREPAPQRVVAPSRTAAAVRPGLAAVHRLADRAATTRSGPAPTVALSGAVLLLGLAVLGRVVGGGGGWSLPRRTPGSHRGRAPPAYALA